MTQHQIKVLSLIAPYPMGAGFSYKEAAIILNCSSGDVRNTIQRIKKSCPKAYECLQEYRKKAQEDRIKIKLATINPISQIENLKIKDRF